MRVFTAASLAIPAALLFSACYGSSSGISSADYRYYPVDYTVALTSVERTVPGSPQLRLDPASETTFRDSLISIEWKPQSTQFEFTLENLTSETLRLEWDGAAIVSPNGSTSRVMHKGVRYMDRTASQPPAVILRGARIDELVAPLDGVTYSQYSGWSNAPLVPPSGIFRADSADTHARALSNVGKQLAVLLPIESGGRRHEYTFTFTVNAASVGPRRF